MRRGGGGAHAISLRWDVDARRRGRAGWRSGRAAGRRPRSTSALRTPTKACIPSSGPQLGVGEQLGDVGGKRPRCPPAGSGSRCGRAGPGRPARRCPARRPGRRWPAPPAPPGRRSRCARCARRRPATRRSGPGPPRAGRRGSALPGSSRCSRCSSGPPPTTTSADPRAGRPAARGAPAPSPPPAGRRSRPVVAVPRTDLVTQLQRCAGPGGRCGVHPPGPDLDPAPRRGRRAGPERRARAPG